jgi:hypothetical protein
MSNTVIVISRPKGEKIIDNWNKYTAISSSEVNIHLNNKENNEDTTAVTVAQAVTVGREKDSAVRM